MNVASKNPLGRLCFDERGLIAAVAQDVLTGEVRMEAIETTLRTGKVTFFSRSRERLWVKGETSGHTLELRAMFADCDGDVLLVQAEPNGPTCHTGQPNCFFRRVTTEGVVDEPVSVVPFLSALERELTARQSSTAKASYTKSLLDGGAATIGAKITEEAAELVQALTSESDDRVLAETADVLFHGLVGLILRRQSLRDVVAKLAQRAGVSGHAEKAARADGNS